MELWEDIKGFEGLYQISNLGNVKSLEREVKRSDNKRGFYKERILKPAKNNKGYYIIKIHKNSKPSTFKIHRLVYQAFGKENLNGFEINHLDGVKTNNNINNLERCTSKENTYHALTNGLKGGVKLTEKDVLFIRSSNLSNIDLAEKFSVSKSNISVIKRRGSWNHI